VARTKERTPELRARVLQVALTVLHDDGVVGFTTRRVAAQAETSIPAVYELFGHKGGLIRDVFYEGFRMLRNRLDQLADTPDPRADLLGMIDEVRTFIGENFVLSQVMFSRPFADFDPTPEDSNAGSSVREFIVGRVRRCIQAASISANETDVAHVLLALIQGLAAQEHAGWLGTSKESVDRRWSLAVGATLDGLDRRPTVCP
jgi:AcrR family transcriptional regulator